MLAYRRQSIPERGMVRSSEPFKFFVGANHISGTADRLRCCQRRWTVSVVNWRRSWSPVCHTDRRHLCTTQWAWCTASHERQRRLMLNVFLGSETVNILTSLALWLQQTDKIYLPTFTWNFRTNKFVTETGSHLLGVFLLKRQHLPRIACYTNFLSKEV